MGDDFKRFLSLTDKERKDIFSATASSLDTEPTYIEKDFWVCHVLDAIYNGLPESHPQILFQGGTSLSKAFNLIKRFSEDIDLIICRNWLGFEAERDPTNTNNTSNKGGKALTGKKRKSLFNELGHACATYIQKDLTIALQSLLDTQCKLMPDADDQQTLLISYPSLYPIDNLPYISPHVKLKAGARSAFAPNTTVSITPYIAKTLGGSWAFEAGNIRVIDPARTCLEKILILHGLNCGYRDAKRLPNESERIARHYYDVAMLMKTGIGHNAIANRKLLSDVRKHNIVAFKQAWKKYEEAVPGTIYLVPQDKLHSKIKSDYAAMQGMIFGEAPEFDWIIEQLRLAEDGINLTGAS